LAFRKGPCCKKALDYKEILFPLEYMGKVPCVQADRLTDGHRTSTDEKSLAELKALSWAKIHVSNDVEIKILEKIPETHVLQWEIY